jgi:hypothetical protein
VSECECVCECVCVCVCMCVSVCVCECVCECECECECVFVFVSEAKAAAFRMNVLFRALMTLAQKFSLRQESSASLAVFSSAMEMWRAGGCLLKVPRRSSAMRPDSLS